MAAQAQCYFTFVPSQPSSPVGPTFTFTRPSVSGPAGSPTSTSSEVSETDMNPTVVITLPSPCPSPCIAAGHEHPRFTGVKNNLRRRSSVACVEEWIKMGFIDEGDLKENFLRLEKKETNWELILVSIGVGVLVVFALVGELQRSL
ncbi:hypothetical protein T439DRAFT_184126 [Meredithblackwellia eburnea MCA 4105]